MSDANITRMILDGTLDHRGGQQFADGKGYAGDILENVHRLETHGFASHPVKGGIGLLFQSRGNRDSAYFIGGENPALRPDVPQGGKAIYDDKGNIIKLFGDDGATFDFSTRTATLTAGGWTINGPVTINGDLMVNGNISNTGTNPNNHSH